MSTTIAQTILAQLGGNRFLTMTGAKQLCDECRARGRAVNFGNPASLAEGIPAAWFGQWVPDDAAQALNIDRINQRGGLRV